MHAEDVSDDEFLAGLLCLGDDALGFRDGLRERLLDEDVRTGFGMVIPDDVSIIASQPATPAPAVPAASENPVLGTSLSLTQGAGEAG